MVLRLSKLWCSVIQRTAFVIRLVISIYLGNVKQTLCVTAWLVRFVRLFGVPNLTIQTFLRNKLSPLNVLPTENIGKIFLCVNRIRCSLFFMVVMFIYCDEISLFASRFSSPNFKNVYLISVFFFKEEELTYFCWYTF